MKDFLFAIMQIFGFVGFFSVLGLLIGSYDLLANGNQAALSLIVLSATTAVASGILISVLLLSSKQLRTHLEERKEHWWDFFIFLILPW